MSTTLDRLPRAPARGAESGRDDFAAARARLTLAVLWLAGLIAWGLLSYVAAPPAAGSGNDAATSAAQTFDGRGKWTGY